MTSDRIKEIQKTTAHPDSVSVMLALKQVWNECAIECAAKDAEIERLKKEIESFPRLTPHQQDILNMQIPLI